MHSSTSISSDLILHVRTVWIIIQKSLYIFFTAWIPKILQVFHTTCCRFTMSTLPHLFWWQWLWQKFSSSTDGASFKVIHPKLCQHSFTIVIIHKLIVHGNCSESSLHSLPFRSSRCPRFNLPLIIYLKCMVWSKKWGSFAVKTINLY